MASKPSGGTPALVMVQKMNLTPGRWCFLAWLCPPCWLLPQLWFSSSNSCAISFSSFDFKFLLWAFNYQEKKGEGHISAKNEITVKSWCPSCQWCGTHREMGGCSSSPFLSYPHTWSSLQTSVCSCIPPPSPTPPPSFHQPLTFDLHWLVADFLIPKLGYLTKEIFFFFFFLSF